jgi:hypothetical protein
MSIYRVQGTQTAAAKTALTIVATATVRPRLIAYNLSQVGTVSVDSNFEIQIKRFTAAGTTTAVTPAAVDSGDMASTFTAGSNASAEPTYTANTTVADVAVNPRSTFRWVALEQRDEVIMPATAANGLGFLVNTLGGATTIVCDATVMQ